MPPSANHDTAGTTASPRGVAPSRRAFLGSLGVAGLSGVAGCNTPLGDALGSDLAVTVGSSVPLSGPYAATGQKILDSITLGLRDAKREGHIEEFELLTRDSETDPDVARQNAVELIDAGADFLQGSVLSPAGMAIGEVGERENVININQGTNIAMDTELCRRNYFPLSQAIPCQMHTGMDYIVRNESAGSVYQISSEFGWPRDLVRYSRESYFPTSAAENLGNTFTPLGASDYSSALEDARDAGAEIVRFNMWGSDLVNAISQARSAGFMDDGTYITMPAFTNTFADMMDENVIAYDRTFYGMHWYNTLDVEAAQSFVSNYRDVYHRTPAFETLHYPVARTLMAAVADAGTTETEPVREAFVGRVWEPKLWGDVPVRFRECDNHNTIPALTAKALPRDEMDPERGQYFEVIDVLADEDRIMFPCEESGCR